MTQPTAFQKEIARRVGVSLRGASQIVAAARIYDAVETAIDPSAAPRSPTEKQIRFASDLGVYRRGDSFRVCAARIGEELRRRNAAAVRRMRLKPGDLVEKRYTFEIDGQRHESVTRHMVSSISEDFRVYFKNPNADSGAWPSQLIKIEASGGDI